MKVLESAQSLVTQQQQEEINLACVELKEKFDITFFNYSIIERGEKNKHLYLTNNPEIMQQYFASNLFYIDALLLEINKDKYTIRGDHVKLDSPYYQTLGNHPLQKIYREKFSGLGLSQGITVVHSTENQYHLFTFASECMTPGYIEFLMDHITELKKSSYGFATKFNDLFSKLHPAAPSYDLTQILKALSTTLKENGLADEPQQLSTALGLYQPKVKIINTDHKHPYAHINYDLVKLSRRELQCLVKYAQGAPAKEIANNLFLSKRTVENHVYNARRKLNISSNVMFYKLLGELKNTPEIF